MQTARKHLFRREPGIYATEDGSVEIHRVISRQTRRPDEICWELYLDGKAHHFTYETLRDAKVAAAFKGWL